MTDKLRGVPSKAGSHVIYTVSRYRKMFTASFCILLLLLVLYTVTARAHARGVESLIAVPDYIYGYGNQGTEPLHDSNDRNDRNDRKIHNLSNEL